MIILFLWYTLPILDFNRIIERGIEMSKKLKLNLQFFADEEKEEKPPEDPPAEEPAPAPESDITTMLMDIQGLLANMQQALDKLAPVSDEPPAEEPPAEDPAPPTEPSEQEVNEIDKLLQED